MKLKIDGQHLSGNSQEGPRFMHRLKDSISALRAMVEKGYTHWIVTFSGGKDSTTTLIVSLEAALVHPEQVERIDIVYSDTMLEIPLIRQFALDFMRTIQNMERVARLPIYCHIVCPEIEQRFWVCLLGKGYPPPHQRFRWCTRRLKIEPVENALKSFVKPGKTLILTGVRFGESRARDARLHQSCGRGGECGQGVWFQFSSRLQAAYMAPIVEWGECDVWDFLQFHAPALGYPTRHIEDSIYNGRETRFGCWICTVVRQDRTMEKITALLQWSHLRPLLDFRQRVKELTSRPESRLIRPDGKPGRLTLAVRRQLLDELLKLQTTVGIEIVSPDEIAIIQKYWEKEVS
jgi:DNA sulfur modification protein DndC